MAELNQEMEMGMEPEAEASASEKKDDGAGIIQIADDVVSSIAGLAVTEVDGVSKLAHVPNDMVARLGRKNLSKSVSVSFNEDDTLSVDVKIEVKYGYNIMDVSKNVQEKVKQGLFTMTGLVVKNVNVKVTGIDFQED